MERGRLMYGPGWYLGEGHKIFAGTKSDLKREKSMKGKEKAEQSRAPSLGVDPHWFIYGELASRCRPPHSRTTPRTLAAQCQNRSEAHRIHHFSHDYTFFVFRLCTRNTHLRKSSRPRRLPWWIRVHRCCRGCLRGIATRRRRRHFAGHPPRTPPSPSPCPRSAHRPRRTLRPPTSRAWRRGRHRRVSECVSV